MTNTSFPWPKKGIRAFAPGTDDGKFFHKNSLMWHYPQHAQAFKTAAEMIIDSHQAAKRGGHHDELLFPVAYLYRHCLELKLKDLTWVGIHRGFFKKAVVKGILNGHNLMRLWTQCKRLLQYGWPSANQSPLQGVEAVLSQFHQVDPNGQKFRYERDKITLKQHRHEKLPEHVSLANLRGTMDAVYNLLDSCEGMMRDEMDNWDCRP